ncbi:unnamed protein product [Orchesella dallaii]|uniref:Uncharacterized protein n=1 Tax=Orchesella dallaii TaxID=48710 RepID=A0ABP1RD11_9HEXA
MLSFTKWSFRGDQPGQKCSFDLQPLIENQLPFNLVFYSEFISYRNPYRNSRIPSLASSPHSLPNYPQHVHHLIKLSEDPLATSAPRKDSNLWPFSVALLSFIKPTTWGSEFVYLADTATINPAPLLHQRHDTVLQHEPAKNNCN